MSDTSETQQTGGFSISLGGLASWIGRVLLATMFIVSGIVSALNFREFSGMISKYNLPGGATLLAGLALAAKILGGFLFTGVLPVPFSADIYIGKVMLIIFTLVATYFAHNPLKDSSQLTNMLKNLAIIGGLLAA